MLLAEHMLQAPHLPGEALRLLCASADQPSGGLKAPPSAFRGFPDGVS